MFQNQQLLWLCFCYCPEHFLNELVKLNEMRFQENILAIDEAKKKSSTSSLTPFQVDASKKFQRQTAFNRTPLVPGNKSFSGKTQAKSNNLYSTLIFKNAKFSRCIIE